MTVANEIQDIISNLNMISKKYVGEPYTTHMKVSLASELHNLVKQLEYLLNGEIRYSIEYNELDRSINVIIGETPQEKAMREFKEKWFPEVKNEIMGDSSSDDDRPGERS